LQKKHHEIVVIYLPNDRYPTIFFQL